MRNIDRIIIHCSATPEGQDVRARDIDKWHREQGFAEIGYHFVIDLDGTVEKGRDIAKAGAHCKGYNAASIGVCYIGGLDRKGNPKDTRTKAQRMALAKLVWQLFADYPVKDICGHRDLSPDVNGDGKITPDEWIKACPCFDVRSEFPIAVCEE